jgi:hypothetical protein
VVWGFGEDPKDATLRVMVPVKNNLAPLGTALAYQIAGKDNGPPYLLWGKEPCDVDANEVLGMNAKEKRERADRLSEAKEWLREYLACGRLPQAQIKADAEKIGIAWRTLRRAKADLGVEPHKGGMGAGWFWELPEAGHEGDQHASP